MLYNIITAKW